MSKKRRFDEDLEQIAYINRNDGLVVCGFVIMLMALMCLILWGVYELSWYIPVDIKED